VDDGSRDASTALAQGYAARHPSRIRYLEHAGHQNRGMSASRNLGIRHARGAYLTFLDADDVFLPRALERMVALLDAHSAAGAVRGLYQVWHGWTGNPKDLRRDYVPALRLPPNTLFRPPQLLPLVYPIGKASSPGVASVMVRREVLERLGGFEEAIRGLGEDQVFYYKLYLKEQVYVTDECWFRYRQHPDSCCATAARTGDYSALTLVWKWLHEYLRRESANDARIRGAVRGRKFFRYRHPALFYAGKRLAQRVLPSSVYRWLAAR
jgi:glycosyltransferase involved in cell wall biosynthesis